MRVLPTLLALSSVITVAGQAQGRSAGGAHSVLLLGTGRGNPRTIAIEVIGDSVSIRSGPGLIVPRRSGFWRLGVGEPTRDLAEYRGRALARAGIDSLLPAAVIDSMANAAALKAVEAIERQQAIDDSVSNAPDTGATASGDEPGTNMHGEPLGRGTCFSQWVWATPLGIWPSAPTRDECTEDELPGGDVAPTFVGPDHVSFYLGVTTDVSYSFQRGSTLGSIDSLARKGLPTVDASLGPDGAPPPNAATTHDIRRCEIEFSKRLDQGQDPDAEPPEVNPDYRGTVITRTPGRWVYARYYALTSYAGRGWEWNCEMKIPVPKSVTGWDSLTLPWAAIKRKVPAAVDAFASPRGDVVVVTTQTEVRVYRARGSSLATLLGRSSWDSILTLGMVGGMQPDYMVMSQWAVGPGAARWATVLAPLMPRTASVQR